MTLDKLLKLSEPVSSFVKMRLIIEHILGGKINAFEVLLRQRLGTVTDALNIQLINIIVIFN